MPCKRIPALRKLLILFILPIILSSCVKGNAHVKVHLNGTANLDLSVAINNEALKILGQSDVLNKVKDILREKDIDAAIIENNSSSELLFSKAIDNKNMSSASKSEQEQIEFVKSAGTNFLFTRYDISVDLDLIQMIGAETNFDLSGIPESVKKIVDSQMKFDLLLTTPIKLQNHNAALVMGKTLMWHINLFEPNHLQFSVRVPNVKNISLTAGIMLFVLLLFIIIRIRIVSAEP